MRLGPFKTIVAAGLLLWQVGMIAYARHDPARYFCWAPHDVMWTFRIDTEVGGRTLDHLASVKRYGYLRGGQEEHAIEHLFRTIRQYETTYGKDDHARVHVQYRRNGGPILDWTYPEQ